MLCAAALVRGSAGVQGLSPDFHAKEGKAVARRGSFPPQELVTAASTEVSGEQKKIKQKKNPTKQIKTNQPNKQIKPPQESH